MSSDFLFACGSAEGTILQDNDRLGLSGGNIAILPLEVLETKSSKN